MFVTSCRCWRYGSLARAIGVINERRFQARIECAPCAVPDSASRIVFGLSAAFAAWCLVEQVALFRGLVPPVGLVQAAVFGVIAVLVAKGSRRALLAAPIAGGLSP